MNANEVAHTKFTGVADGFAFGFGIDHTKVAAQLRKLADAIDAEHAIVLADGPAGGPLTPRIHVRRLEVKTTADFEDFTMTEITMVLAEKVKA